MLGKLSTAEISNVDSWNSISLFSKEIHLKLCVNDKLFCTDLKNTELKVKNTFNQIYRIQCLNWNLFELKETLEKRPKNSKQNKNVIC